MPTEPAGFVADEEVLPPGFVADEAATKLGDVLRSAEPGSLSANSLLSSPVQAPDLSGLKLSPYEQATMDRGGIKPESGMESGTELTTAVASDPVGFAKSIPSIAGGVMSAPGRLAYAGAADLVSKGLADWKGVSGDKEPGGSMDTQYGGNLAAMMRGEDQLPADKLINSAAQSAPNLAVGANIAKSIAEMAPLMGMSYLPAAINRIAAGAFSLQMIAGVKDTASELGTELGLPADQQDAGKIARLKSDLIQTGVFAPLAGAGALSRPVEVGLEKARAHSLKRLDELYAEEAKRTGVSETPPGQRDLSPQGEIDALMKEGAAQPPSAPEAPARPIPPPDAPAPAVATAALAADMDSARRVAKMSDQEFMQAGGSFNKTNVQLGENATAEQVAELKQLHADAAKELQTILDKADNRTATMEDINRLGVLQGKVQYFSEAIQAAPKEVGGIGRGFTDAEKLAQSGTPNPSAAPAPAVKPEIVTSPDTAAPAPAAEPTPAPAAAPPASSVGLSAPVDIRQPVKPEPKPAAPEKGAVDDWTSATEETPTEAPPTKPGAAPLVNPPKTPTQYRHSGIPLPKFENRKMSPLDRVTASHSAKLQKSFDEARRAQRDIKKAMPSDARQAAASIYREAGGDMTKLKDWETRAKQKWMRDAARDAQTLTPDEIAIVRRTEAAFAKLEARGNRFDVLQSHRDNYIPHVWDVAKPGTGFGGRMLQQRFRFSKARTFDTFFDGDQAGFKPKTLAIGKLLPAYIHEMNKVIADRQAVRDIVAGTNPDGSPMAVPRGTAQVVDGDNGQAVLVQPRAMREADTRDYKEMSDQPALANWTWASKDTDGNPIFIKSNLALHPDAYRRVNAILGQSALRQWYRDPVSGPAQIPRAVVRGLDTAQSAMKREMFSLLAPFHQVQEGTHGIGHLVNPFSHIPKVDLRDPAQLDAAKHGLMLLPDRASASVYIEGVGSKSSLISQGLRKAGPVGRAVSDVIDGYQDYLFHQYIPGLKFKTYQAMLGRNMKTYAAELKSGEMTPADVKITSAEQANAAYGHLNYALLDRNPTIQHLIQMAALAPDFLEARSRFAAQAIKGLSSKVGHEQFKAIAILAAVQASSAYILSNVTGGEYDPKHPFEVIHNGRRYSMRSVPEDIFGLLKDTRQFLYSRVNPLTVKGGIQLATGLNYRGEKVSALDTFEELLAGYIPITARQIPGIRSLTETSRQNPVSPLQQLAGSLGLRISRYSPVSETYKLAGEWMDKNNMPRAKGSYPISKYQQFRYALEDGDLDRAKTEYDALLKTMPAHKVALGFKESINHPFTGNESTDEAFSKTLSGYDKQLYYQANITRSNILKAFDKVQRMKTTGAPSVPVVPQF